MLALAHRGGAYHPEVEGLENTLAAFRHAVELGYRYLETDVHVTRDGVLLAVHDAVLDRVTDRRGAVAEMTHAEVREGPGGFVLHDDGSTNGTYVNRRLIEAPEILADGDEVQVGKFRLVFIA